MFAEVITTKQNCLSVYLYRFIFIFSGLDKTQMSHKYWTEVGGLGTSYGNIMVNTLSEERISFDTYMRILELNQSENRVVIISQLMFS